MEFFLCKRGKNQLGISVNLTFKRTSGSMGGLHDAFALMASMQDVFFR